MLPGRVTFGLPPGFGGRATLVHHFGRLRRWSIKASAILDGLMRPFFHFHQHTPETPMTFCASFGLPYFFSISTTFSVASIVLLAFSNRLNEAILHCKKKIKRGNTTFLLLYIDHLVDTFRLILKS